MKKVHLLVINAFLRPFAVTFFIVMFVLLMLFLFRYADDLIGKGFEWYVLAELLWYTSATNVAMALPLSILLSSIMTFGSLGEHYELVAIKAAGVSLRRAMYPLFVVVGMLAVSAFLFADYMLPLANLKMGSLLYDVRNKKASFLLEEKQFNTTVPGYAIRVGKKDADERTLHDVVIYNQAKGRGGSMLIAKRAEMYKTPDNNFLVLKLYNGVRYEESSGDTYYNPRQRLTRTYFASSEQALDLSSFQFKREQEALFKSNYMMLNTRELQKATDSLQRYNDSIGVQQAHVCQTYYQYKRLPKTPPFAAERHSSKPTLATLTLAEQQANMLFQAVQSNAKSFFERERMRKTYVVEYLRKFTLPVSCLVLFLIGAPMGAIIRKGGLGLPLVVCVLFFLAFHIVATIAEKWSKEGTLDPLIGMWTATALFGLIGIFLTYKASVDSKLFDIDIYKKLLRRKSIA